MGEGGVIGAGKFRPYPYFSLLQARTEGVALYA